MKRRSGFTVMTRLIGLVKPLTGYMILAILLGLLGQLSASLITILGGYAILEVLDFDLPFTLTGILTALVVLAVLRGPFRYGEQLCNHFIAFRLLALIRDRVFAALRRLCPAKLEGKDKGNLISVITADIELLEVFYAHTVSLVMIALLFTLFLGGFISSLHPVMGAVAFTAYLTVGILIPVLTSMLSGDMGLRFRQQSGELNSFVLDSLRGLDELIQYHQGDRRLIQMNKMTDELSAIDKKMKIVSGRNMAVTNTVILLFDLVMILTSAILLQKGQITFEKVLLANFALMSSFGPTAALANLGSTLQNTFAAGNRVLNLLEETPVVEEIQGKQDIGFTRAKADAITFTYGEEIILKDVNLEIPERTVVGIVGKSGSGKSTLLKLFMRFWKVEKGRVEISGRNIEEINTVNLRELESFMTQETHLFHDSVKNNLLIARPEATDEELAEACKKASLHDFIMSLPKGYDTSIGELGDTLSGGERQRIGLARVFLHHAPFILLDEPTSNLDSLNEAVILKSLKEEGKDKTVILVSHRKSTMCIADMVYSIEELSKTGRVS